MRALRTLLLGLLLTLGVVTNSRAASVTLSWDASTDESIVGYTIYYGTDSGNYTSSINAGNVTTYTVSNLTAGVTYYFAATAYNSSGQESDYSAEVSYTPGGGGAITIGDLTQVYDGTPKGVTITTTPTGLAVQVTYNGSTNLPINAGSYAVVATIDDSTWAGSTNATLVVNQATASVSLGNVAQTYTGSPLSPTVTTMPAGLATSLTYNGSANAPSAVGSYAVVATVNDANYSGSATGTLTVSKSTATVAIGNLAQTYSGTARTVTATTSPSGLAVGITYNGSATAPTNAGSYTVVGTINDAIYQGSATNTLLINKAAARAGLANLTQTYDGTPKSATAITSPSGLSVDLTYNGSASAPTAAGSYTVVGTINDANYTGHVSGPFTINKGVASVTLAGLSQTYDGTAKRVTATTTPRGLTVLITYDGAKSAPTNSGLYQVIGSIDDPNYAGSATNTLSVRPTSVTLRIINTNQTYNGQAHTVSVLNAPSAGVSVTYDGTTNGPVDAGTYTVAVTSLDPNASGSLTGALVVAKASATVTLSRLSQIADGSLKAAAAQTSPAGLPVTLTYNGQAQAPSQAGDYAVSAQVNDRNYQGQADGTLSLLAPTAAATLSWEPTTDPVAVESSSDLVQWATFTSEPGAAGGIALPKSDAARFFRATAQGTNGTRGIQLSLH